MGILCIEGRSNLRVLLVIGFLANCVLPRGRPMNLVFNTGLGHRQIPLRDYAVSLYKREQEKSQEISKIGCLLHKRGEEHLRSNVLVETLMAPGPDSRLLKVRELETSIKEYGGSVIGGRDELLIMPGCAIASGFNVLWTLTLCDRSEKNILEIAKLPSTEAAEKMAKKITAKAVLKYQS